MRFTYPVPFELSLKLYRQNAAKYSPLRRVQGRRWLCCICRKLPTFSKIAATMTAVGKYTVVELTYAGKHYHGLTAKADCDDDNGITGIAIAYNRAFIAMIGGE